MLGYGLNILEVGIGLDILTCHHMEKGKVPSSMAGSQDALLPIPIGRQLNQTISITMKIMQQLVEIKMEAYGMTFLLKSNDTAAVSTLQR
jgi:hypothetical protein